jgi:hypothetical protein
VIRYVGGLSALRVPMLNKTGGADTNGRQENFTEE